MEVLGLSPVDAYYIHNSLHEVPDKDHHRKKSKGNNKPLAITDSDSDDGKRLFRCGTCSYVTDVKARYTKHVKYHSMPLIKCDFCDFKTPYKWNLDRHYKNHNGEGDLHCPLCNFTADIKQSLTVHLQNHHSSYPGGKIATGANSSHNNNNNNNCKMNGIAAAVTDNSSAAAAPVLPFDLSKGDKATIVINTSPSALEKALGGLLMLQEQKNGLDLSTTKDSGGKQQESRKRTYSLSGGEDEEGCKMDFLQTLALQRSKEGQQQYTSSEPLPKKKEQQQQRKLGLDELTKKLAAGKSENGTGTSLLKSCFVNNNSSTSSSRCQYCRQRCKTSADLALHMAVCTEASKAEEERGEEEEEEEEQNKIFVWNNMEEGQEVMDVSGGSDDLVGFEMEPGVGAVHVGKLDEAEYQGYQGNLEGAAGQDASVTKTRKVFRCPQAGCGFWATTASRFHVHIVGHYNLKPFGCSQCSYKSNWKWDITKHIKLKAVRDPQHLQAKVLLTNKSGQRNYRDYDRYLVMMELKYSADSKLPDCSTVANKRTDVAMEVSPGREIVPSPKGSPVVRAALPKLTRAPYPSRTSSPSESVKSDESGSKRPPPALVPIIGNESSGKGSSNSNGSTLILQKKILSGGHVSLPEAEFDLSKFGTTFTLVQKPNTNGFGEPYNANSAHEGYLDEDDQDQDKKSFWKCKKCSFKNANKEIVVMHIRQFHKPKRGESVSILSGNHLMSVNQDEGDDAEMSGHARFTEKDTGAPNCNFSCSTCAVTFQTRRELVDHAERHIWEARLNQLDLGKGPSDGTITAEETPPRPRSGAGSHKKYHCVECPYVTDSKGQFLYHKQFHRPRDCPFKCNHCSYTVSHKHLLHQHLRVHGVLTPASSSPPAPEVDNFEDDQPLNLHASVNLNTTSSSNNGRKDELHPTVLVWRNGRPLRMYRCSQCPQVFANAQDMADHEANHNGMSPVQTSLIPQSLLLSPNGSNSNHESQQGKVLYCCESCPARFFYEKELEIHSTFHQTQSEYQCDLCSYSAKQQSPHLMSHMKVHGYDYQQKTLQLLQRYPKASKLRSNKPNSNAHHHQKSMPSLAPQPKMSLQAATSLSTNNGIETTLLCQKCPAKLASVQAYTQHLSYHGRNSNFKCRHCDYSVDSMKNLTLHELLHVSDSEPAADTVIKPALNRVVSELVMRLPMDHSMEEDVIDDDAFVGNPEFNYPTYVKNGRVKSKRYKCSKCPSAFEKRDQYKVHMGLHGSDQRYKCPVCDYAVTYYANFIQHLKKHSTQPEVPPELLIAKPLSKIKQEEQAASKPGSRSNSIDKALPKEVTSTRRNAFSWKCDLCPFSTDEVKARDEHRKRHMRQALKGSDNQHTCTFCDYTVPTKTMLKDHIKLHFQVQAEQIQSFMYASDVDIFVNGNYEEKIYSEKENYEEDDDNFEDVDEEVDDAELEDEDSEPAAKRPIKYIDIASRLPVSLKDESSDDDEDRLVIHEAMDCTS